MCPFYSEWASWNWEPEGNRDKPIRRMDDSYYKQQNDNGVSYSCDDTCGKRIKIRERECFEVNLKGKNSRLFKITTLISSNLIICRKSIAVQSSQYQN